MLFDNINEEKIDKLLNDYHISYKFTKNMNYAGYKFRIKEVPYELWLDCCNIVTFGIVRRQFDKPVQSFTIFETKNFKDLKNMLRLIKG